MAHNPNLVQDIIIKSKYFQECLENLLFHLQSSFYGLELIMKVLIHGPDGSGKRMLAKTAAKVLNMNFCEEQVADLFDENIIGTDKKVRAAIIKAASSAPCIIYLTGYEMFCLLEDQDLDRIEHSITETLDSLTTDNSNQPIVFICATSDFPSVNHGPLNIFHFNLALKPATLAQAQDIIKSIEEEAELSSQPSRLILNNTRSTGDYYVGNLFNLVAKAESSYRNRLLSGDHHYQQHHDHIKNEDEDDDGGTRWADIGGLGEVKQEIVDTIQLPLDYPQLKKSGLFRTGVLLYGPPGTGKTLLARAVATECSLNFINVKGPELLNEYVGQSEENVRKLFQRARESSPAVIFFDELDSLAPNRGQAGDSGGVMDRIVSQILAEMDGVGKKGDVFVIGATNRLDMVDPALLRPGRFDKVLEVPLPQGKENRIQILKALTRKFQLAGDVDIDKLESMAPPDMSGADFQCLCSRAMHNSLDRCIEQIEAGKVTEEDASIITSMEDFLHALQEE